MYFRHDQLQDGCNSLNVSCVDEKRSETEMDFKGPLGELEVAQLVGNLVSHSAVQGAIPRYICCVFSTRVGFLSMCVDFLLEHAGFFPTSVGDLPSTAGHLPNSHACGLSHGPKTLGWNLKKKKMPHLKDFYCQSPEVALFAWD